jgi:hypothetical protein
MANPKIFIEATQTCESLPLQVRDQAQHYRGLRDASFDHSYLDFLDQQIQLSARGPEWTERLKKRRSALAAFCNTPHIDAHIQVENDDYWIRVDPMKKTVIYWEVYDETAEATQFT